MMLAAGPSAVATTAAAAAAAPTAVGVEALGAKLRHPLRRIRARALANLRLKLEAGLVRVDRLPGTHLDGLTRAVLDCLADDDGDGGGDLEAPLLRVLGLLMADAAALASLHRHGAARHLQRRRHRRPDDGGDHAELDARREELLRRLLQGTTDSASPSPPVSPHATPTTCRPPRRSPETATTPTPTAPATRRRGPAPALPALASAGWRFPEVPLAPADDQFLFEFEVTWRLRTTVPEVVAMCDAFRRELLRDFPPELFLQRPGILRHLLHLARQPVLPPPAGAASFGVNYFAEPRAPSFAWKPSVLAAGVRVACLKALESLLAALRHAMRVSLNPVCHVRDGPSAAAAAALLLDPGARRPLLYPRTRSRDDDDDNGDRYSLSGAVFDLMMHLLPVLRANDQNDKDDDDGATDNESASRVHVLNLLGVAIALLPERAPASAPRTVELNARRLEAILEALDQGPAAVLSRGRAPSRARMIGFLHQCLTLFPSTAYAVGATNDDDDDAPARVRIPRGVWDAMVGAAIVGGDGLVDLRSRLLTALAEIHPEVSAAVAHGDQRRRDVAALRQFVETPGDPRGWCGYSQAQLVLMALEAYASAPGMPPIKDRLRGAIRSALPIVLETPSPERRDILAWLILAACGGPNTTTITADLAREVLSEIVLPSHGETDGHAQLDTAVLGVDSRVAQRLLVVLVTSPEPIAPLWRVLSTIVQAANKTAAGTDPQVLDALIPSQALLQHLAYADATRSSALSSHQSLQRGLIELLGNVETRLTRAQRLLSTSRCLIHKSHHIRTAAASGLLDLLRTSHRPEAPLFDPFGQFDSDEGKRVIETDLAALCYPDTTTATTNGDSSRLPFVDGVVKLRRLLAALSPDDTSLMDSSLHQLQAQLISAPRNDFQLLEDAGEVGEIMRILLTRLQTTHNAKFSLQLVQVVLHRSKVWRDNVRRDDERLALILSNAFDPRPDIRAVVFMIVLALTCTMECFALPLANDNEVNDVRIPIDLEESFALFREKWERFGIKVCSIRDSVTSIRLNSSDLGQSFAETPIPEDRLTTNDSLQPIWRAIDHANSYRSFTEALYQLLQQCHASSVARRAVLSCWKTKFAKYFEFPPTSPKDEVVLSGILGTLDAVVEDMSIDDRVDLASLIRRAMFPYLKRSGSDSSPIIPQLLRLTLHLNVSFTTTPIISLFDGLPIYQAIAKAGDVKSNAAINAMIIRSAVDGARRLKIRWPGQTETEAPFNELCTWSHFLVGCHRVPGSFRFSDMVSEAAQFLMTMEFVGSSLGSGMWTQNDSPWFSRLVFDSSSASRAIGLLMAGRKINMDRSLRDSFLRMIIDSMRNENECDIVRAAAVECVSCILHSEETCQEEARAIIAERISGAQTSAVLLQDLCTSLNMRIICPHYHLQMVKMLRLLCDEQNTRSVRFGDVFSVLNPVENADGRLDTIAKLLSLRLSKERYITYCMEISKSDPDFTHIWTQYILPPTLLTITQTARLFQYLARQHGGDFQAHIITGSTLVFRVGEAIVEITENMQLLIENVPPNSGKCKIWNLHASALDEMLALMAALLSVDVSRLLESMIPAVLVSNLLESLAFLIGNEHTRRLWSSAACLVPLLITRPTNAWRSPQLTRPMSHLFGKLWVVFQDLSTKVPMGRILSESAADRLTLKRVSIAICVLLASTHRAQHLFTATEKDFEVVVSHVRTGFQAIRMSGGFGVNDKKQPDHFTMRMIEFITDHLQVLVGMLCTSDCSMSMAVDSLVEILTKNWSMMRIACGRGSSILLVALRLILKLIQGNERAKARLATVVFRQGGVEGESCMLAVIFEFSMSSNSGNDEFNAGCSILKSALISYDCIQGAIKLGFIPRLLSAVIEQCKRKVAPPQRRCSSSPLSQQLGILASIASREVGRQAVLQNHGLRELVNDLLNVSRAEAEVASGTLFIRNLSFAQSATGLWESVIEVLASALKRFTSCPIIVERLAGALWAIIFDNQRAQTFLRSKAMALSSIKEAASYWSVTCDDDLKDSIRTSLDGILCCFQDDDELKHHKVEDGAP